MKRTVLLVTVLSVAALALLTGCGSSPAATKGGAGPTTSGGAVDPRPTVADPYPTVTPVSPNEKKAVAGIDKALKSYISMGEAGNKQNNQNTQIFYNKQGYKPRFVGYEFTVLGPKGSGGKYPELSVSAFDGGKQIKPDTLWQVSGGIEQGDGRMAPSYYDGVLVPNDPSVYTFAFEPVSPGEKAAKAAVEAWVKKNTKAGAFDRVLLTGYLVVYGDPKDRPNMIMSVNTDGFSTGSVVSWDSSQ
ncbi:MAG: hypothetical protein Q7W30_06765 [Coriobacteriia bacterium]|nr:hypothetical protein [Coriobacteriia bacterium]